jgi:hypothetical protein
MPAPHEIAAQTSPDPQNRPPVQSFLRGQQSVGMVMGHFRALSSILLLFASVCATCRGESLVNESNAKLNPSVLVTAESQYVVGFPIVIAVALRNATDDTDFLSLPKLSLLHPLDSIQMELEPVGSGGAVELGPYFDYREQGLFRTKLRAGESTRMLVDLSQFGQSFSPGHYRLRLLMCQTFSFCVSSPPVQVELLEPSSAEHAEATRLRRMGLQANAVDSGSWLPFLTSNWNTVAVASPLSATAMKQLSLYLALHRAGYGPVSVAQIPTDTFQGMQGQVLSAEAGLLDYEIIVAHGDHRQTEQARSELLRRWPDMQLRMIAVDRHEGLLSFLRKGYGVERAMPLPGPLPLHWS